MAESRFVYVTYIRATRAKLWEALLEPEFTKKYWMESWQECDWTVGAEWRLVTPGGKVADSGEVLEIEPERKLVLSWSHLKNEDMKAEGASRMTYELEDFGDASVKLTVIHEIGVADSKMIGSVSQGWPAILASLKSLLETGEALADVQELSGCE